MLWPPKFFYYAIFFCFGAACCVARWFEGLLRGIPRACERMLRDLCMADGLLLPRPVQAPFFDRELNYSLYSRLILLALHRPFSACDCVADRDQ